MRPSLRGVIDCDASRGPGGLCRLELARLPARIHGAKVCELARGGVDVRGRLQPDLDVREIDFREWIVSGQRVWLGGNAFLRIDLRNILWPAARKRCRFCYARSRSRSW